MLRRGAALALVFAALVALTSCSRGFTRVYEYEEQVFLDLSGSAEIVVNASLASLAALRGLPVDTDPNARVDRAEIRAMVEEPGVEITRVSRPWRRDGRRFVQIRAEVADIRTLASSKLFGWSQYALTTAGTEEAGDERYVFTQTVGEAAASAPEGVNWTGSELVAFKLHLPSRIHFHNVRNLDDGTTGGVERGNILTWEQRLSDRLAGQPIEMRAEMDRESILYRTLLLFAAAFGTAMLLLGAIIWRVVRRGRRVRAAAQASNPVES